MVNDTQLLLQSHFMERRCFKIVGRRSGAAFSRRTDWRAPGDKSGNLWELDADIRAQPGREWRGRFSDGITLVTNSFLRHRGWSLRVAVVPFAGFISFASRETSCTCSVCYLYGRHCIYGLRWFCEALRWRQRRAVRLSNLPSFTVWPMASRYSWCCDGVMRRKVASGQWSRDCSCSFYRGCSCRYWRRWQDRDHRRFVIFGKYTVCTTLCEQERDAKDRCATSRRFFWKGHPRRYPWLYSMRLSYTFPIWDWRLSCC